MVKLQEIKKPEKPNGEKRDSVYFVVVPLNYVKGFGWKTGDKFDWQILGKDRLRLIKNTPGKNTAGDFNELKE